MTPRRSHAARALMLAGAGITAASLLTLFAAADLETLIDAAFDLVCAAVACDFASAFYRSTDHGLFKQRDSRGRIYDPAFMRRYMELTPALPIAQRRRGVAVLPTRSILPPLAELRRTPFYREIMEPQGWRHAVALCFWGNPPADSPVFVCSLYRANGRSDFTKRELATLEALHAFLDCAVNRLNEREAAATMREGMELAVEEGSRAFVLLDRNLRLVQATGNAIPLMSAWAGDSASVQPSVSTEVPLALKTACLELHRAWQALVQAEPDAPRTHCQRRIAHPRLPGVAANVTMVCPPNSGLGEATFLIDLDRRIDSSPPTMLLVRLSAAERAVALVLADGLSNQEIADRLGKSLSAVKFLLHRIYQKTGLSNRAAVVAALRPRTG